MEGRFEALEETVQRLVQNLANVGLFNNDPPERHPLVHQPRTQEDKNLRIDVLDFDGLSHEPEYYLDWESRIDQYFEFKDTPPDQQYKLARVKMIKIAATWLEGLQRQRLREGRGRINTWEKLRKHMRRKYVPPTYRQQLYVKLSTLTQGAKSVQEYIQEWEKLSVLCDVAENEEMRVGKFIAGLREEIRRKLVLQTDLTIHLAGLLAITIE